MTTPTYELFAIKYADNPHRRRIQHFLRHDLHDGPSPMDFFVWVAVGGGSTVLIDVGGTERNALARGHRFLRSPPEALRLLDIDPAQVDHVVITHMHWDHAGNAAAFPRARFHVQLKEMQFATGPYMEQAFLRHSFAVADVCEMVRLLYDGRLRFIEGSRAILPGIEACHVGGHTAGQQIVRVHTRRGWVVLASDAAHLYENIEAPNPFPVVFNVGDTLRAFETIAALADSADHIVPGHDPLVLRRYPAPERKLDGLVAVLDAMPTLEGSAT